MVAALRETQALMAAEAARGDYARRVLAESTAALAELDGHYADLGDVLRRSGRLLGSLYRSEKSDTWYLTTAFWMLVATTAWLVYRRLLSGPLWLLVWLFLRPAARAGGLVVGLVAPAGKGAPSAVVDGTAGRTVMDIGGKAVPTAAVGGKGATEAEPEDPDSLVEKIGRILDEDARSAAEAEQPNPKKRMWEEERVRDEL